MIFGKRLLAGIAPAIILPTMLTVTTGLMPGVAAAATDEIIVTVRRREENLQDIPMSVTSISAEELQNRGIKGLDDLVSLDASVIVDNGFSSEDVRIAIRGLTNTRGRSNVAFLVDNIDVTSESAGSPGSSLLVNQRLLGDIERVSIVKGPQGALYGRAAFAGAIAYVTKNANLEAPEGNIGLEYADYNRWQLSAGGGTPIIPGKLAIRGQAVTWDGDSFYDNTASGRNLGGPEGWATSLTLNYEPSDKTSIKWRSAISTEEAGQMPQVILGSTVDDGGFMGNGRNTKVNTLPIPPQALKMNGGPLANDTVYTAVPVLKLEHKYRNVTFSENPIDNEENDGSRIELFRTSLQYEHEVDEGTFTSTTGYTNADIYVNQDADYQADGFPDKVLNTLTLRQKQNTKQLSQEFRFASNYDGPLNFTAGLLGWRERRDYQDFNFIVFCKDFLDPICATEGWQGIVRGAGLELGDNGFFNANTRHYSAYGLLEYQATERLKIDFEARYVNEFFGLTKTLGTPCTIVFADPNRNCATADLSRVTRYATVRSEFITPKLTAEFAATDDLLLYFSAGKGQKPAGISTFLSSQELDKQTFGSEKLWAYEAGWKSTMEGSWGDLVFNGAVFFQDYSEKQVQVIRFDPILGAIPAIENASAAEVFGQELALAWSTPLEGLRFDLSYTHLDTKFVDFVENSVLARAIAESGKCDVTQQDPNNPNSAPVCRIDRSGNELERSPDHAFTGAIEYQRPLANTDLEYLIQLDWNYTDERFTTFENYTVIPQYSIWNLRVGLEADDWDVMLFANNLLDDDTLSSGGTTAPDFGANAKIPPDIVTATQLPNRRLVGIRFNKSFGD